MLNSPTMGLLLLISSSFSVVSSLYAEARGLKVWQAALIGFLSWPLAFVLVEMCAEGNVKSKFYKRSRSSSAGLGRFRTIATILLAPALGGLLFAGLVSNFYSGEMPQRHGKLYATSEPIVFYISLFSIMCLAAFFSAAGLALIVYTILGRKEPRGR